MLNTPRVSIVIPCFNHKLFLEKSVLSAINQTYENVELLVIDDGSSDGSQEILKNLALNYKFTLILQENMGLSKTLNKAINDYATGDYIAVLASDDYFHPLKIEKQVNEVLKNTDSEFCYTKALEFDSKTRERQRTFPEKKFVGDVLNKVYLRQPYAAGSILFSRELYNLVRGFDDELKYEDWDFSIRCAAKTQFSAVDEVLFYYRSHNLNVSKTMSRQHIFQQKLKTLNKNKHLVSVPLWGWAVFIHFIFDFILFRLNLSKLKRFLH